MTETSPPAPLMVSKRLIKDAEPLVMSDEQIQSFVDPNDFLFKNPELVRKYVRAFAAGVTLQPPTCACLGIDPSDDNIRWDPSPESEASNAKWDLRTNNLKCGDYTAHARPCQDHQDAVPARVYEPQHWKCAAAEARGDKTLTFRRHTNQSEYWGRCISCGYYRKGAACDAPLHKIRTDPVQPADDTSGPSAPPSTSIALPSDPAPLASSDPACAPPRTRAKRRAEPLEREANAEALPAGPGPAGQSLPAVPPVGPTLVPGGSSPSAAFAPAAVVPLPPASGAGPPASLASVPAVAPASASSGPPPLGPSGADLPASLAAGPSGATASAAVVPPASSAPGPAAPVPAGGVVPPAAHGRIIPAPACLTAAKAAARAPVSAVTSANRALASSSPPPLLLADYPPVEPEDQSWDTHCRFCRGPLPLVRDAELIRLLQLPGPASSKKGERHLNPAYCERHLILTVVIPAGVHAQYPQTFDATRLTSRIKAPWVWPRIRKLACFPLHHPPFKKITDSLAQTTLHNWQLAPERFINPPASGYYGDVGFYIIMAKLVQLENASGFPGLERFVGDVQNMQLTDLLFFQHILTPAAIVFLIMEDLDKDVGTLSRDDFDQLYETAAHRARASHKFGQALHGLSEQQIADIMSKMKMERRGKE